ncbi:MAG: FMN-binding protein [Coprobacillus sp.]
MKTWKKVLIGLGVITVVIGGIIGYVFIQQKNDVDNLKFSSIDMRLVKDGLYNGEVNTTLIKAEVQVEVNNHRIKNIMIIKHDNGLGKQAETMIDTMKENNTYDVDTVSGATLSSQVIKSAVSQALEKGI